MSTIPPNSLVLITGVNGFIASHVADQSLRAGFRVRGTVRDLSKGADLAAYFDKTYGDDKFSLCVVPDLAAEGAFDEAIKEIAGVIHVASNMVYNPDPNIFITPVLSSLAHILNAARATPSVKRFVLTSSSMAAIPAIGAPGLSITSSSWALEDVAHAWAPPPYDFSRMSAVYGASKTQAEQALWDFMEKEKPQFTANAVLPNVNLGPGVGGSEPRSTGAWVRETYETGKGGIDALTTTQYAIDVRDTARLHVAALSLPAVTSERIFGMAHRFSKDILIDTIDKVRPGRKLGGREQEIGQAWPVVEDVRERAGEILREFDQHGFISLEDTIRETLIGLE